MTQVMTLFNNSSDDDSSTYLLTYEGTAVSDARATGRVLSSKWEVFPTTQVMMQRSELGVLPTWGGDLELSTVCAWRGTALLLHPLSEGPPLASPLRPVRDQRPPSRTSARPTALTCGVAAAGVGAWRLSTCVRSAMLPCRAQHGGSSRSSDNRGTECSRIGYLGPN